MSTILQVFKAVNGRWDGRILRNGEEKGLVSGCDSPDMVKALAYEAGINIDRVERIDHDPYYSREIGKSVNSTKQTPTIEVVGREKYDAMWHKVKRAALVVVSALFALSCGAIVLTMIGATAFPEQFPTMHRFLELYSVYILNF